MSAPGASSGRSARLALLASAALLALAAWFYVWTATSAGSPPGGGPPEDDLYNRLADGFLAGRLGFAEEPPAQLSLLDDPYDPKQNAPYQKYHDVSYYGGRYYLYFGPVPALVLLAPWKAVTGRHLPQNLAVVAFAWGAALLGTALVWTLRRRHFPQTSPWIAAAGTAAVCFGNFLPVLLRRPIFYELAIAAACCFGMAALLLLHRALGAPERRWASLAGASLALGLAAGCRPDYVFGAFGALGAFLWCQRTGRSGWRAWRRPVLAAALPLGAVGLLLMAYNYARFGDCAELGTHYMLAGSNQANLEMTSLRFVPINFYYYFLARPQLSAFFPFFQVIAIPRFHLPEGYQGEENVYGALFALPLLWALAALVRPGPAAAEGNRLRRFAGVTAGLAGLNAALILVLTGAAVRYQLDFIAPLIPLACAGVMAWEAAGPHRWKLAGRLAWIAALAWTLLFNVFTSFQHNELLRYFNPAGYRRLAHAFDHLPDWLGETGAGKTGPLRIRLKFPPNRTGKLEPLVVTGLSFRADFLWVYYVDDRHIEIGFEHTSYGGPKSPPLEIDPAAEHILEVRMGSLYPPLESPYFDRIGSGEAARLKHTLSVRLDGREVLGAACDFYDSSPGDVAIGRNPVSDAFGRQFTGSILQVSRLGRDAFP